MNNYRKRIPYGMMNFVDVRKDDCYFVDKTRFIPTMEQANKFFFFIRPRRFGKSLTMSMLHHYYDVLAKDMFEELYGGLYIGQHPTPERNSYLIIQLNFAVVNAELNNYRKSLDAHCDSVFQSFCRRYAAFLPDYLLENLKQKNGAVEQLGRRSGKDIEPGCEIVIPTKKQGKRMTTGEVMAIASGGASLASVVVALISILK